MGETRGRRFCDSARSHTGMFSASLHTSEYTNKTLPNSLYINLHVNLNNNNSKPHYQLVIPSSRSVPCRRSHSNVLRHRHICLLINVICYYHLSENLKTRILVLDLVRLRHLVGPTPKTSLPTRMVTVLGSSLGRRVPLRERLARSKKGPARMDPRIRRISCYNNQRG